MSSAEVVNTRTGVGAAIGGLVGFMMAGPLGAGLGALVGGGVAHASGDPNKGVMTPKRKLIFTKAMESIKDSNDLKKLADAFSGEGLHGEAALLNKRAELRTLTADVREKRRAAFRKAMASDNERVVEEVAQAFQDQGAFDAAKTLREHAEAIRGAHHAGKSTKPMPANSQAQFAEKLGNAIVHFGPTSSQALQAASNLIAARGRTPTTALINEVVKVAAQALQIPATAQTVQAVQTAQAVQAANSDGMAADGIEQTKIGPPAEAIEPEQGVTAGVGAPDPDASNETAPTETETEDVPEVTAEVVT